MTETLVDAGYEVLSAEDGVEACELLSDPDHVQIVVTDLHMPRADGVAVARCARARDPDIPVLFVSARCDVLESLDPPMPYRFLPKPFTLDQLVTAVRDAMIAGSSG